MAEFASKGVAGAGLGLGIAGTALGLMCGDGLGGLFGNGNCCNEDHVVNRYELGQAQKITELETEVKLRDANIYTDQKLADVYEKLSARMNVEGARQSDINMQQAVYNATNTAGVACLKNEVDMLAGAFKLVIPSYNVCNQDQQVVVTNTPCNPVYADIVK